MYFTTEEGSEEEEEGDHNATVWIIAHFHPIRANKAKCLLFVRQSAVATDL